MYYLRDNMDGYLYYYTPMDRAAQIWRINLHDKRWERYTTGYGYAYPRSTYKWYSWDGFPPYVEDHTPLTKEEIERIMFAEML